MNYSRAGLILLSAAWFDDVIASGELAQEIAHDAAGIREFIQNIPNLDLLGCWRVHSDESLEQCCRELRRLDLDLCLLVFQVWAEDSYLQPLMQALGDVPIGYWCFQPWQRPPNPASFIQVLRGSGLVGALEGSGTLRNLGVRPWFCYGSAGEERLARELAVFARACLARRRLRSARFGLLPGRNEQMQSTFVDEIRLRTWLGPQVKLLSVGDLRASAEQVSGDEVEDLVAGTRAVCRVSGVSEESLQAAARLSLGLAQLASLHRLDVLALNDIDPELHAACGLRPTLFSPHWVAAGCQPVMEGDLGAAVAALILKVISGGPLLLCEFWFWDETENLLVGGHAGLQDPACADPASLELQVDSEYRTSDRLPGAHYHFIARPGRATLLHLRCTPDGWQAVLTTGQSLGGAPRISAGYPHAALRLDRPVSDFLRGCARVGATQHFMLAFGDFQPEVQTLFELLHIPLEIL